MLEHAEQHGKEGLRGANASTNTSIAEKGEDEEMWSEAQIAALQVTASSWHISTVQNVLSLALAVTADNPLTHLSGLSLTCRGHTWWQRIPQRQTSGTMWRSMCQARVEMTALHASGLPTPHLRSPKGGQARAHWQQKPILMTCCCSHHPGSMLQVSLACFPHESLSLQHARHAAW